MTNPVNFTLKRSLFNMDEASSPPAKKEKSLKNVTKNLFGAATNPFSLPKVKAFTAVLGEAYTPLHVPNQKIGCPGEAGVRYKFISDLNDLGTFNKNAIKLQTDKKLEYKDRTVKINIQHEMMNGQFKVIAKIHPDEAPLIDGIGNDQLLVSTFRDHNIMVHSKDSLPRNAHLNVLAQYNLLKTAGIPVAEIYNTDDVRNDCGYFLVEYVPHAFQPSWEKGAEIAQMTPEQHGVLDLIKNLLQQSYKTALQADLTITNNVVVDLKPDNLRYRDNGELIFIDIREKALDTDISICDINAEFVGMIKSFNCEKSDEIYNYLNPMS